MEVTLYTSFYLLGAFMIMYGIFHMLMVRRHQLKETINKSIDWDAENFIRSLRAEQVVAKPKEIAYYTFRPVLALPAGSPPALPAAAAVSAIEAPAPAPAPSPLESEKALRQWISDLRKSNTAYLEGLMGAPALRRAERKVKRAGGPHAWLEMNGVTV